jgi:homoserine dehydrogenase
MEKSGFSFSAALGEAKQFGYVEGNPDADLEGWDARRKLAILANTAFGAKFSDDGKIPTTGIKAITEADFARAHEMGGTIKLIAAHTAWARAGRAGCLRRLSGGTQAPRVKTFSMAFC